MQPEFSVLTIIMLCVAHPDFCLQYMYMFLLFTKVFMLVISQVEGDPGRCMEVLHARGPQSTLTLLLKLHSLHSG